MGNICGCVRGPKEECYVDPKKAPFNAESKELKGRRYFQRKKRKSEDFQRAGSLKSPGNEDFTSGATCGSAELQDGPDRSTEGNQAELDKPSQVEKQLSRQGSISKGVYVGEVPVLILRDTCNQPLSKRLACRLGRFSTEETDSDRSRSSVEGKLRCISATSKAVSAKDGLLVKKLLQRQLRRAVSFGAVEHMLQTLRGNDRPGSEETFAKIIWGSQAHRKRRRRAYTCSGYVEHLPAPAKCISTQPEVNQVLLIAIMSVIHDRLIRVCLMRVQYNVSWTSQVKIDAKIKQLFTTTFFVKLVLQPQQCLWFVKHYVISTEVLTKITGVNRVQLKSVGSVVAGSLSFS